MGKSNKRRKKVPKAARGAKRVTKRARLIAPRATIYSLQPAWRVRMMDLDGEWGWGKCSADQIREIQGKLAAFEGLTWGEIERRKSCHSTSPERIIRAARNRLVELGLDDLDKLYQLRFGSTERVWGVRVEHHLMLLWWDPKHAVWPTSA